MIGTQIVRAGFSGFGQEETLVSATEKEATDPTSLPVSTISFYPDGTTVARGVVGNTLAVDFLSNMESALGVPEGEGRTASALVDSAKSINDNRKMWMAIALIGIPVAGLIGFSVGRKSG